MINPIIFERRLRKAETAVGELRGAGFRADVSTVDGYPGFIVTGSEGARMYFTVSELGVLPRALLVRVDGRARTGLGGLRRFSAQLAIAAVAAGVMLLTAAIGGTQ